jgi:pyruvate/2-oxoglutarate dehydrogenase complex dihydrolipoamide dehydrogenase (E3) component
MAHVHGARNRIAPHDSPERFRGMGVDVIEGTARFVGDRELEVDGRRISARHIVIATGSRPAIPPIAGIENVHCLTNENVFEIARLPERLIVLGAGPVGLELAQGFARLGSQVTVLERGDVLLPRESREPVARLAGCLEAEGVRILLATEAERVERDGDGVIVHGRGAGGATFRLSGTDLLVATGRRPNLDTIDAAAGGVETSPEGVIVDAQLRTSAPGVWAAGDIVSGAPHFTHVADYQARLVLRNALFPFSGKADYGTIPWVTYTDPELAHLGLTPIEAEERHGSGVQVFRRELDDVDRAIADARTSGVLEIVADRKGKLIGAHVLGYGASSIIGEIALAMHNNIPLGKVASTVHAYPSYPEAFKQTADAWSRGRLTGLTASAVRWLVRR